MFLIFIYITDRFVIIESEYEYTGFSKTSPDKSNNGFCVN